VVKDTDGNSTSGNYNRYVNGFFELNGSIEVFENVRNKQWLKYF